MSDAASCVLFNWTGLGQAEVLYFLVGEVGVTSLPAPRPLFTDAWHTLTATHRLSLSSLTRREPRGLQMLAEAHTHLTGLSSRTVHSDALSSFITLN